MKGKNIEDRPSCIDIMRRRKEKRIKTAVGIDVGCHTGIAIWDCVKRCYTDIRTMRIDEALFLLQARIDDARKAGELDTIVVRVEDARKRTWYGERSALKLQGAGSVKRDSTIWDEYLKSTGVAYTMVAPVNNRTKMTADSFRRTTGYTGRTNEHNRDAAMLVFGM